VPPYLPAAWSHVIARQGHPIPGAPVLHGTRLRMSFGALSPSEAAAMLEGLTAVDCVQLMEGVPPLSAALHTRRLRYDRRLPMSWWRSLREVWELGAGTCADLAAGVAAELRVYHGVHAVPVIYHVRPGLWHAVVRLPNGEVIDPSRTGGMTEGETPLPLSEAMFRELGIDPFELALRMADV